jgi:hypothetical protein
MAASAATTGKQNSIISILTLTILGYQEPVAVKSYTVLKLDSNPQTTGP